MNKVKRLFKMATAPCRYLPSFVIIGAQKSATSSLYDFVTNHPKVLKAEKKEIHYYDISHRMGLFWYRSHFPIMKKGFISGESTPSLIRLKGSLSLLKRDIPEIKILAIFRDPVERTISHYFHNIRKGREKRSFMAAVSSAESLSLEFKTSDSLNDQISKLHYSYIGRSMYMNQLSYLEKIFNPSQLLMLKYSDVILIQKETRQKIFKFLDLDDYSIEKMSYKNKGQKSDKVQISPDELAFLEEKLKDDKQAFLKKLGWSNF